MTIQTALPKDKTIVLKLAQELATSFVVNPTEFPLIFDKILRSPHMHLAVAIYEDETVGYILGTIHPTFYANGNVAWVEELLVKEAYRRAGTGKQLMQHFEDWATSHNCGLIALATRRAGSFYTAIGYSESATYLKKHLDLTSERGLTPKKEKP